jgi:uracil phosphoribosyltransferase
MSVRAEFPNLFVLDHPLIQHKLSLMRDKRTPTIQFRHLLREIALLMGYEISRELPLTTERIETPLTQMDAPVIAGKKGGGGRHPAGGAWDGGGHARPYPVGPGWAYRPLP